jgi:hypothetical protein
VCYSHDVDWILKLELPLKPGDDLIASHYEKSRIFTMKSAYRLAYNINQGTRWKARNSQNQDNSRNIWKMFWNTNVPKKVQIIGWRAVRDNLAKKQTK